MSDPLDEILASIRAEVEAESADRPHLTIHIDEVRLLVQSFEILHSERAELRRKVDQHNDVVEAVNMFIEAYREKYKNYGSGGIRPSAVLRREVRMIWAALNGNHLINDSGF